ncbi:MAG TPA: hypothetical protein VIK59_00755 [Verrucomicrobiae bacterium]
MKNLENQMQQQFRDISKIQVKQCRTESAEYSVNEALKEGWQLLLIQFISEKDLFVFVLGWPGFSKAPLTNREKSL